jgi:hypothetical protein
MKRLPAEFSFPSSITRDSLRVHLYLWLADHQPGVDSCLGSPSGSQVGWRFGHMSVSYSLRAAGELRQLLLGVGWTKSISNLCTNMLPLALPVLRKFRAWVSLGQRYLALVPRSYLWHICLWLTDSTMTFLIICAVDMTLRKECVVIYTTIWPACYSSFMGEPHAFRVAIQDDY